VGVSLVDRGLRNYPESFFCELEKSNAGKGSATPVAAILIAGTTTPNSLPDLVIQALILQIATTHRVALKVIHDKSLFGQKISEIANQAKQKPKLLMVAAHGDPDRMRFREDHILDRFFQYIFQNKDKKDYCISDVKKSDFSHLDQKEGQIILFSCCTGQNLAQKIADVSKLPVLAPKHQPSIATCLVKRPNNKFHMISYGLGDEQQHVYEFESGKTPKLLPGTFQISKKNGSFSMTVDYVRKQACNGNPIAQLCMGLFSAYHISDEARTLFWLSTAVEGGNSMAKYLMEFVLKKERAPR